MVLLARRRTFDTIAQRQIFDPKCPSGGRWYACSIDSPSQFVGCCASTGDPCGESSCSAGDLRPASYDSTYYYYLPDVSCPSTSSAYKCTTSNSFSFFGCCKRDPCSSGSVCARSDLDAASLPSDSGAAAVFLPSSTYSSSKPTSTPSVSRSSNSSTVTSFPTSSVSSTPLAAASSSNGTRKFIIAGASGGVGLLAIVLGWLLYHCLYARKSRKLKHEEFDRRWSGVLLPIETVAIQTPKQEAVEPEPAQEPSSISTPPRNVYGAGYGAVRQASPVSASRAYALPVPHSTPSPVSHTLRGYNASRNDASYSRLSQSSGDTVQEELEYPRASSAGWHSCPNRGLAPSHRGSGDELSGLPPVIGRRSSGDTEESRYYTDSYGRERVNLVRSGTVAPTGQTQWDNTH